ncbi:hypothetical protein [Leptolyngbya ohadii]|uniref:hypothetical protein n=1 Tax=Leptolyngbya ohadii TaxID=1962290 RepID=UPI000B598EEF|nr:hypothetical protein [Leptolyngbya ohadii]
MARIDEEMAALMDDKPQVGEDTPSRPKKVIAAPTRSREQSAETAPEPVKIAEFREFGKGSGALLFGKAAEVVADALQVEQHTTNSDRPRPYVKLTAEQVAEAVPVLEEQGWDVRQKNAEVTLHGKSASVRGDAAVAIANEFGFALGATTTGTAKVKFDQGKLEEVIGFLKDRKFVVEVDQAEPSETNKKPVVVFRESLDSDDYKVFEASAENLAKALEREPDRTPGGRAVMEVTAKERKQIVRDLGDQLDTSVKPMPEAKLTLYAMGGGNVIGAAATEVAAALNLETESVTRKADGATFPKVTLQEDQIETAKAALEGMFTIKTEELEPKAIIKTDKEKQEIVVIGAAAPFAATAKGVDLSVGSKSPYVRLPESDLGFVKSVLKEAGFNEFDISESKPLQRSSQASASRSQRQAAEPEL